MLKVAASLSFASVLLISGCSNGLGIGTQQGVTVIPAVHGASGVVFGGQQPLKGATIKLWTVGTTGYGSTGSTLSTTTTLADGSFSLTGTYVCPASNPYVYITATGGDPGVGSSNAAISLLATLADCNSLLAAGNATYVIVNEVTTVADTYALAQFMSGSTGRIGSYGYANTGLNNAFATASNLVNTTTGSARSTTPPGNGVVPQAELNTMGNILATCVNTAGPCTAFFANFPPNGGTAPTNTLLAALSLALHPGANVANQFALASGSPPFQPSLSAAPNDWTVALSFNGNAPNPGSIAIDGFGNVWTANYGTGGVTSSISKLSNQGGLLNRTAINVNGASGIAIDASNQAWVANFDNNSLSGYLNNANPFAGPVTLGLNGPTSLAFDPNGHLWITNNTNNSVAEYNTGSLSLISPGTGYTGGGLSGPTAIALDTSGNAWINNAVNVTELSNLGVPSVNSPLTGGGITSPLGIAVDASNNIWISNNPGNLAELSNSGTPLSGTGYTGGGAGASFFVAIDGAGNAWTSNEFVNQLAEFTSSGAPISPATGYQGGGLSAPSSLAIDGSGNVWVGNANATPSPNTISEFIGVAVPVVTPMATALQSGQLSLLPGTPVPVVIQSNALPYYTPSGAAPYSAQLYATGGNSGTYTWSLASGAFPSPLSISSSGLISGIPLVTDSGTSSVNIQACDSLNLTNCSTQAFTLTANTTVPALGNEAAMTGTFAIQLQGYKNNLSSGQVVGSDLVASINFAANGTLTGELDANSSGLATVANTTITGNYNYGSDNRGTLVLFSSAVGTKPLEFAFAGSNFTGITPHTLRLIEFDDTVSSSGGANLATGAGIGKFQASTAFTTTTLGQSWVFGLQGETPCNNCNGTIAPFGPLTVTGKFTANTSGSVTFGEADAAGISLTYNGITLAGSYTNPDGSGRGTLTLTPTGTLYPAPPSHYIYYIVNAGEMYLMSSDGHATNSMLSGDALVQQTTAFSNSTISGSYVAYEQSGSNGDAVSKYPTQQDSSLIYITVSAGNQLAARIDENNGQGRIKLEQSQGPFTYAIDSNGRMTLGSGQPVFYLANGTQFFGIEQPSVSKTGGPALITGTQQTAAAFGCPTNGFYTFGTVQSPVELNVNTGVGNLTTGTITADSSDPSGVLRKGLTGTITCTTDNLTPTTGRVTFKTSFGTSVAAYPIVLNSKYVLMSINPADGQPAVVTLEK